MADDLPLRDNLSPVLQCVIDNKLLTGENVLITLAGASGEALAVTDRRVIIAREQVAMVGGTEVDCFSYFYEQIQTINVVDAVGGGHLNLTLFSQPTDPNQITIYFPSYDITKFEVAAARIRLLLEQTSGAPAVTPTAESPGSVQAFTCPHCAAPVQADTLFCSRCGAAQGRACVYCDTLVPATAKYCGNCGTTAEMARELICHACKNTVAPSFLYCPACRAAQRTHCISCLQTIGAEWRFCPNCGANAENQGTPSPRIIEALSEPVDIDGIPREGTAEEHNHRGRRLYEEERYIEAVAEFREAIRLNPGSPLFHCNLGVTLAEMGHDKEAETEYQTAIELDPDDPTAYLNLGYFHANRGNTDEALRQFSRTVEVAPDSPEAKDARENIDNMGEV
jgi:RNA polymerase subunit RPABC4/transcription elongation factor Spt4